MTPERWSRLARLARRAPDTLGGDDVNGHEALAGELDGLLAEARRALARRQTRRAGNATGDGRRYAELIGESPPMQALFALLDKVVDTDSTVLIEGENGTGKELVARAIHRSSARHDRTFVAQNCSAWNDELLGSELFGHSKGAFTGALATKPGLFDVADGGTFFLDEIGDTSAALQVKLLRVLQEGTFTPVGGTKPREVDVRVITATNHDLAALMAQGRFREDLYYRINVIRVVPPPLRDRPGDIALLVTHFLGKHASRLGRGRAPTLTDDCMRVLEAYRWPGNVRELENEIERLVVLAERDERIEASMLSARIAGARSPGVRAAAMPAPGAETAAGGSLVSASALRSATLAASETVRAERRQGGATHAGGPTASVSSATDSAGAVSAPNGGTAAAGLAERGLPRTLESVERDLIDGVLRRHEGNKTRAARELRISRRNLIRKVQKYQLDGAS